LVASPLRLVPRRASRPPHSSQEHQDEPGAAAAAHQQRQQRQSLPDGGEHHTEGEGEGEEEGHRHLLLVGEGAEHRRLPLEGEEGEAPLPGLGVGSLRGVEGEGVDPLQGRSRVEVEACRVVMALLFLRGIGLCGAMCGVSLIFEYLFRGLALTVYLASLKVESLCGETELARGGQEERIQSGWQGGREDRREGEATCS
jgi:hypothetical protein